MSLRDRLRQSDPAAENAGATPTAEVTASEPSRLTALRDPATAAPAPVDPFAAIKRRAQDALFARLGSRLYDSSMDEQQLDAYVLQELSKVIDQEQVPLTPAERARIVAGLMDDVLGYGAIEKHLADPEVTEVMVNSLDAIFVERNGRLHRTSERYLSDDHLRQVIERIVSRVGRRIDESSPMVDARLPDGSRVNAIIPPLSIDGPVLTIRKFSQRALSLRDLVGLDTVTPTLVELIGACVEGRLNILVSGGTGTGKTTLLNALSGCIPDDERLVTVEDAAELRLSQPHVIRLESRPPNIEGRGEVTIRDLVRNALRMRPDRIIVGEVRGAEALDMLQAMNTGHEGSLSTLHANSPRDALSRLETMTLMAGVELPIRAIREQATSAIDVIVHISRLRDGTRRVTQVVEVAGMEGDTVTLTDLYSFDFGAGIDEEGRFRGTAMPTGLRPRFLQRLTNQGITVPDAVFTSAGVFDR
ncbi:MAG: CpaF family protein [Actinomycetes bacterium]